MTIEIRARVAQNAFSRLQGAVGQLGNQVAMIKQQRENNLATLLAIRRRDFPGETELASYTIVEASGEMIDFDTQLNILLDEITVKLQTATSAVQAQIEG